MSEPLNADPNNSAFKFLTIESSCDDTSVAVMEARANDEFPRLLSLSVQSQNEVHEKFGGIVPELASRAHLKNLIPCIEKCLTESSCSLSEMKFFAATAKPGLIGSLLVGHSAAKTLSLIYSRPFISCDHLESHLQSIFLSERPKLPMLSLLVSGGHTSLYLSKTEDDFEKLGVALDDAAGEAFDKAAKLLGYDFPGGPEIEKNAKLAQKKLELFPKVTTPDLSFSFSGLKSELVRLLRREPEISKTEVAYSFQEAVIRHIVDKSQKAIQLYQPKSFCLVGGVARNMRLRECMQKALSSEGLSNVYVPEMKFCTDNAAMVGVRAFRMYKNSEIGGLMDDVRSSSRPPIKRVRRAS